MRTLKRNKQMIIYRLYIGREPVLNDEGQKTGEWEQIYDDFETAQVNISAGKTDVHVNVFGITGEYDRVIVYERGKYKFDENTIMWIDEPDTSKPHNYICKSPVTSLNYVALPVKKVNVSG